MRCLTDMRTTRSGKLFTFDAPDPKRVSALRNLPDHSRQSQPDYRHLGFESTENTDTAVKACIAIKRCVSMLGRIHRQSTSEGMA